MYEFCLGSTQLGYEHRGVLETFTFNYITFALFLLHKSPPLKNWDTVMCDVDL